MLCVKKLWITKQCFKKTFHFHKTQTTGVCCSIKNILEPIMNNRVNKR